MRKVSVDKNIAVQSRVAGEEDELSGKSRCSVCAIDYRYVKAFGSPRCPLCDMRSQNEKLRETLKVVYNQLEALGSERDRLLIINNTVAAYKSAIEVMSGEDFAFFKGLCYIYKQNPNTTLIRATVAPSRKVNGIMLSDSTNGLVDSHHCHSIGGVAAANVFHESASEVGLQRAMAMACRAFLGRSE